MTVIALIQTTAIKPMRRLYSTKVAPDLSLKKSHSPFDLMEFISLPVCSSPRPIRHPCTNNLSS